MSETYEPPIIPLSEANMDGYLPAPPESGPAPVTPGQIIEYAAAQFVLEKIRPCYDPSMEYEIVDEPANIVYLLKPVPRRRWVIKFTYKGNVIDPVAAALYTNIMQIPGGQFHVMDDNLVWY